jgi:predicted nucleotidyltransferase
VPFRTVFELGLTLAALQSPDYTGCMNLAEEKLDDLRATLGRDGRIDAAYLLGSAHEGTFRPDSDVDVAVLPAPGVSISAMERLDLAAVLAEAVGRTVDLGVLDTANLVYAREAVLGGICIFSASDMRRDLFAATALGLYARLRDERREVENAYRS